MIHDARIIHMDGRPDLSPTIRRWMGDSIGHRVGNTLVVDTTNFNDSGGFYGDAGGNFGWDRNLHPRRALQLVRRQHAPLSIRDRRSDGVHPAVERRVDHGAVAWSTLRICLPRSEIFAGEHAQGISRCGTPARRCPAALIPLHRSSMVTTRGSARST